MDIVIEGKYLEVGYKILDSEKKTIVQQTAKEQYLACALILQSNRKIYTRII